VIGVAAPNLGQISLSNNQLTRALSASLGNFSSLQKLLLDHNAFYGAIPRDIEANLPNRTTF
jgi:Leucine-rich repeat (LRR) protein